LVPWYKTEEHKNHKTVKEISFNIGL
jgi:hypothetical protein